MLDKKLNAHEARQRKHRARIGVIRTGLGLSSICWALFFVCLPTLTANGQSARTTYGRIMMPKAEAISNGSVVLAQPRNSSNNAAHTRELGPQSAPSSATHLTHRSLPSTMRLSQQPLRRSAERISRERVQVASYQDGISDSSTPEPNASLLPAETSLLDTNEIVIDPSDTQTNSVGTPIHEPPSTVLYDEPIPAMNYSHGEMGEIVYCDSHGTNCECNVCVEDIHRFKLGVGVLGFNNPLNYAGALTGPWSGDGSGSFGLQQTVQWGTPITGLFRGELGGQFGARFVQANFAGAEFTTDNRNQAYLTAGLFRRVDFGIQGGLVVDYLAERWYLNCDMVQLRGELSYMVNPCHEFGFRFTSGMQTSRSDGLIINDAATLVTTSGKFGAINQHRFFYRQALSGCTSEYLEFSVGWTEEKHGILGGMLEKQLTDCLSWQSNFTFATPGDAITNADHQHEQWQLGMTLVWSFGIGNRRTGNDYYRPLFEVADPGSFLVAKKS